jgi:RNA-directed DNA polymerase
MYEVWLAKSDQSHRFWGLFAHITKIETLEEAYRAAKRNGGAPFIDGQKFEDLEQAGRVDFLAAIREDLETGRYKPMPNRRVDIPIGNGIPHSSNPCIRDRVVQGALKFILEAIFEGVFARTLTGSDPGGHRTPHWRKSDAV